MKGTCEGQVGVMSESIIYLALGDSLTAGYGAPPGRGFVDVYRMLAEQRLQKPVTVLNKGVNGARTNQVLQQLRSKKTLKNDVRKASLITITAGGNDMLDAARTFLAQKDTKNILRTIRSCKRTYQEMLQFIFRCKKGHAQAYQITIANLYNPFPQFKEAVFGVTMFNRMLNSLSDKTVCIADVYQKFIGNELQYISEDFVHPNDIGYKAMAEAMAACGMKI